MSTLLQLRTRCKTRFRDLNNAIYSDSEWDAYINDAYGDLIQDSPLWPFLRQINRAVTYPAQATSILLPTDTASPGATDVYRVSEVFDITNRVPLAPLFGSSMAAAAYPYADTAFGNPIHYNVFNNSLEVYPRPLAAVTLSIRYSAPPPTLTLTTDVPQFPSQYHGALVSGALRYAYADDGNLQAAAQQEKDFEDAVQDMMNDLLSTQTESYPVISDVWEWE